MYGFFWLLLIVLVGVLGYTLGSKKKTDNNPHSEGKVEVIREECREKNNIPVVAWCAIGCLVGMLLASFSFGPGFGPFGVGHHFSFFSCHIPFPPAIVLLALILVGAAIVVLRRR